MNLHSEITNMKTGNLQKPKINTNKRIKSRWRKVFTRKGYTFWSLSNQRTKGAITGKTIKGTIYQVTTNGDKPRVASGYYNLSALMRLKGV